MQSLEVTRRDAEKNIVKVNRLPVIIVIGTFVIFISPISEVNPACPGSTLPSAATSIGGASSSSSIPRYQRLSSQTIQYTTRKTKSRNRKTEGMSSAQASGGSSRLQRSLRLSCKSILKQSGSSFRHRNTTLPAIGWSLGAFGLVHRITDIVFAGIFYNGFIARLLATPSISTPNRRRPDWTNFSRSVIV